MFIFRKRKKSIYSWTRSRPTRTFGESNDQVRDKSESKYQRVQDKPKTIKKRLESGTGLKYYSPTSRNLCPGPAARMKIKNELLICLGSV